MLLILVCWCFAPLLLSPLPPPFDLLALCMHAVKRRSAPLSSPTPQPQPSSLPGNKVSCNTFPDKVCYQIAYFLQSTGKHFKVAFVLYLPLQATVFLTLRVLKFVLPTSDFFVSSWCRWDERSNSFCFCTGTLRCAHWARNLKKICNSLIKIKTQKSALEDTIKGLSHKR